MGKGLPKLAKAIKAAVDSGAPIEKLSKVYGYKPEVLQKIADLAKKGESGEDISSAVSADPVLAKVFTDVSPPDQPPKAPPKTYKYAVDGREKWGEYLDFKVNTDQGVTMRQVVTDAAKKAGVDPGFLYASAMEEGMNKSVDPNGKWFLLGGGDMGFPVSGFDFLGLDNFSSGYDSLKQSYGVDIPYKESVRPNEKAQPVKSANFKTTSDALLAKAYQFRQFRDQVANRLQASNMKMSDDGINFLTMQAYNAGMGVIPKYLKKYKDTGLLEGDKFLDEEPPGGYEENQSYVHARRRMDALKVMRDNKIF